METVGWIITGIGALIIAGVVGVAGVIVVSRLFVYDPFTAILILGVAIFLVGLGIITIFGET